MTTISAPDSTAPPGRRDATDPSRPIRRIMPAWTVQTAAALLVVIGVLTPVIPLFYASIRSRPIYEPGGGFTLQPYRQLFTDPAFWQAARNTLEFATISTVTAVGIGGAAAIACNRTNILGRRAWSRLLLAPLLLPPLGMILGWNALYGPGGYATTFVTTTLHLPLNLTSIPGMSALGAVIGMPVALLTCQSALANVDSTLADAARASGARPMRIIVRIMVPMLRPALINAALLVFTLSFESLGIALILGQPAGNDFIASYLYNTWANSTTIDPAAVSAGAMLLLLVAGALLFVRRILLGSEDRFVAVTGRGRGGQHVLRLPWAVRVIGGVSLAAYFTITTLGPIITLALQSSVSVLTPLIPPWRMWSAVNWQQLTQPTFTNSIRNSVEIALAGAVLTTIVIALATVVAHRSSYRFGRGLQLVMMFPRSMPGIIVGIGFFWAFVLVNPPGSSLRNSVWGIMLALSVRSLTLAYLVLYPALAAISHSLDDAARSAGASWWQTTTRIVLPNLRPALLATFILLFVSILNDYDPALFLVTPGHEILGVTMIGSLKQGSSGPAATLAIIQVGATLFAITAGIALFRLTNGRARRAASTNQPAAIAVAGGPPHA